MEISALRSVSAFLHSHWRRVAIISLAVVTPCFWQRHLEAGDLASHLYNAWLAQLIQNGHAPGLYLARQWNNVLFDFALTGLGSFIGLQATEKIATSVSVLIFFWGAFAWVCALSRRVSWPVCACIAMFAYGWTFQMGFLNFYLSAGLAFFGLAFLQQERRWRGAGIVVFLVPLATLIWLAHPLGELLLFGGGAYILVADRVRPRYQTALFALSALALLALHLFLRARVHHGVYGHDRYGVDWPGSGIPLDGFDQLALYGRQYLLPAIALQIFVLVALIVDVAGLHREPRWWTLYLLPLQLYVLAVLAATLLPTGVRLPQYTAAVQFLTERLTSISAVLVCCVLACARPRKWHSIALIAIAAVFFFHLYRDTAAINSMEDQVDAYVLTVPPGARVVATVGLFPDARLSMQHIVDRACIGRCFSYDNYEPWTNQFRVRAYAGNPIVMTTGEDVRAAENGRYLVQQRDLPLFGIYQCGSSVTNLCMRPLLLGEKNGKAASSDP